MKNSTLIALHEANELPDVLMREWSDKNSRNPTSYAKQEIRKQESYSRLGYTLLGIAIMAMMSVFLIIISHKGTAEMSSAVYSKLFSFLLILCVLTSVAARILIALSINDSESDFGTQLEKLREVLGLTYGEMRSRSVDNIRYYAEGLLTAQVERVKIIQGSDGENSPSDEAKKAREKYEEIHSTLFAFGLCEEKWDKYWKSSQSQKLEDLPVARSAGNV